MKIIKINESQKNRLFEAYDSSFSFETLSMIGDSAFADENTSLPQIRYCVQHLGKPVGMGSSRAVFTLTDNLVLKLAYGNYLAGREQNRIEADMFKKVDSPLLAKVLYCDKNNTFLVSENVVPAKPVDFENILGLPYWTYYTQTSRKMKDPNSKHGGDLEVGYDEYFEDLKDREEREYNMNAHCIISYIQGKYAIGHDEKEPEYDKYIRKNAWFKELVKLVKKTKITDLVKLENFGIVNRNGQPIIVILDSGFNSEVYQNFYQ